MLLSSKAAFFPLRLNRIRTAKVKIAIAGSPEFEAWHFNGRISLWQHVAVPDLKVHFNA